MNLSIEVDKQAREFFTCCMKNPETNRPYWHKTVGHLIKVDEFEFVVVPYVDTGNVQRLNVFEKTSGAKLFDIAEPLLMFFGATVEGTVAYFETEIGSRIADIITKVGKEQLQNQIIALREKAYSLCGEMPVGEVVNVLEGME